MDFKALRAAKNKKAQSMIESSGGKVDSSTWTPDEKLNAEAKTGMRPISRRAFKTGGKVEGEKAKTNLSRSPRGFKETVGLANTNQKDANEEREGKKHIGGFKRGGRAGYQTYGAVDAARLDAVGPDEGGEASEPTDEKQLSWAQIAALEKASNKEYDRRIAEEGRQALRDMGDKTRRKDGGRTAKASGGSFKETFAAERKKQGAGGKFDWNGKTYSTNYAEEEKEKPVDVVKVAQSGLDKVQDAKNMATAKGMGLDDIPRPPPSRRVAPVDMPTSDGIAAPEMIETTKLKRGGAAKKKYEGSPKDNLLDAKMAKKRGMTHAEWEDSPEDKRMDAKGQREMNMRAKKMGGGGMEMLSPAMRLAKDPQSMSPAGMMASGMKKGGAAKKAEGGGMGPDYRDRPESTPEMVSKWERTVTSTQGGPRAAAAKRSMGDETRRATGGKAMHHKDCMCKACGGSAGYKNGGGLYANINAKRERGEPMRKAGEKGAPSAKDFKDAAKTAKHDEGCTCKACGGRMGRATGGRTKGTTNISINVMPHTPNKPMGIQPPMPPMPPAGGPPPMGGMPPPMPMPPRGGGGMPPGLMAAMSGAAGAPPPGGPPPGMGMPPPPMGRKAGGKVYPKMKYGAGGGKGRLEKIDEYGNKA